MNNKKTYVALVVILLIAIGAYSFPKGNTVVNQIKEQLGAVVGPELTNNYWNFAGFKQDMRVETMKTATSTVCVIKTPTATSTLVAFYANFSKPPTVTTTFVLSTSTTSFSTSSPIFSGSLAANGTTTLSWFATTTGTTAQNKTLVPNTFIVFDLAGAVSYSGLQGRCYGEFRSFE